MRISDWSSDVCSSDLFVPIESAAQEDEAMANARRLFDELRRGANFAGLARQFSQSGNAILGGDLGWVQDGELEDQLNDVLAQTGPGAMSMPIRTLDRKSTRLNHSH